MKVVEDKRRKKRPIGDFPWFLPDLIAMSKRAKEAMEDLLAPHGEFLLVECDFGEYYLYNAFAVLDALDDEKTIGD
ncbi:hypothetical protein [Laceyella putida]|uniref:Uncharacterized protein n=1 Tax=Laceyella putida TaxID=110101 RepID=A0ABW2RQ22_9BACL